MSNEPRFAVGTVFMSRGRHPRKCVVTDILTTTNLAGKVTSIRYVATHEFAGQLVTDSTVTNTTIAMGLVRNH